MGRILKALSLRKIAGYTPYPKQLTFHNLRTRERALLAGNQLGKTLCAGNETSYHLTGDYPDWWEGRRFTRPTRFWCANTNNEQVRAGPQRILLGDPGQWGTGTVPRSALAKKPTMARGMSDLVDSFLVRHVTGGFSFCQFKAYEQGRKAFQTMTLDGIWLDEECPIDIYTECLARISATGGVIYSTMTPLLGLSELVTHFYPTPDTKDRGLVTMDISEALHYDEDDRAQIIAAYPEHERDARSRGLPMLGEGKIFTVPQSTLEIESFQIPTHWLRARAVDFGYGDHPFAAVEVAYDRESDLLILVNCYKEKQMVPAIHASSLKAWDGERHMESGIPVFWPHDGHRDWGDSGPVAEVYRKEGLKMWREHSTFKEGGYSPEAGVHILLSRMQTGRFKAFSHLTQFWHEFGTYHRKDGQIVKKNDDVLSALRQAVMMLRFARTPQVAVAGYAPVAEHDWNPFDGGS